MISINSSDILGINVSAVSHQWINSIIAGVPQLSQPAFSDISGTATLGQLPSIAFSNITGQATLAQLPTLGANTVLGSIAGGTPIALTTAQHTTLVNTFTTSLSGAVPAPGTSTGKILRDDATWVSGGTGTVTSIGLTNTYGLSISGSPVTTSGNISAGTSLTSITNSLGADVALNNTANYFDGPSVAQGTSGTWLVTGTVTLTDTAGAGLFYCKLWDGTTVIDSSVGNSTLANAIVSVSLSGVLASPAANIRISCRDTLSTSGKIIFNSSSNSKDSTITAVRIA